MTWAAARKRVFPQAGAAGVALLPEEGEAQPQDALLRDLHQRAVRAAGVRHNDQVVGGKEVGLGSQEKIEALAAPRLFVRHQGQAHGAGRGNPQVQEGLDGHEGGHNAVMVVLGAPADKAVAVHPEDVGVLVPQFQVAWGDHVQVGEHPGLFGPLPRQEGHQVGAFTPRHPGVRGRVIVHLEAPTGEQVFKKKSLLCLAGAALVRPHGHPGHQLPLEADHLLPVLPEALRHPVKLLTDFHSHLQVRTNIRFAGQKE